MNRLLKKIGFRLWRINEKARTFVESAYIENLKSKMGGLGRDVAILPPARVHRPENFSVGDCTMISHNFTANCAGGLEIGDNCSIGPNCNIHTNHHEIHEPDALAIGTGYVSAKVTIGRMVFIGARVTILPGVTVGEGAVIGMNSVVTKDIPPLAIAVGSPAKAIKFRDKESFERLAANPNKRIWAIRGDVGLSAKRRRRLCAEYGVKCRKALDAAPVFQLTDDNCAIPERWRIQVMYYIAVADPALEFVEHGDSYAVRRRG